MHATRPAPADAPHPARDDAWITDATEADFDATVVARSSTLPVLLDIGADWCGPCRVLTPLLERLAREYEGRFVLVRVDADENMRIAGRHKVRGFPTVIGYSRGREVSRFHSAQPERVVRDFIERLLAAQAMGEADQQADSPDGGGSPLKETKGRPEFP